MNVSNQTSAALAAIVGNPFCVEQIPDGGKDSLKQRLIEKPITVMRNIIYWDSVVGIITSDSSTIKKPLLLCSLTVGEIIGPMCTETNMGLLAANVNSFAVGRLKNQNIDFHIAIEASRFLERFNYEEIFTFVTTDGVVQSGADTLIMNPLMKQVSKGPTSISHIFKSSQRIAIFLGEQE